MDKLRLVLVLVLAALLDLGSGPPLEVSAASEEIEDAAHGRRRLVRLAGQPNPPSTRTAHATVIVVRVRPGRSQPRARASSVPVRKTPAPPPDPAAATEDH